MELGLVGWWHLFQIMVRPKENAAVPGLVQGPLIWGGRGSFDSKSYITDFQGDPL